ncbi:MAG: STAS domain-containing protein [Kiritimatiellae bacterium]|nr:STAS domain-containing protein [Kiritimatiellia bacterium]MDD4735140.1 STAS domain-containing protein [Kiritimatiellia bacterium]
MTLKTTVRSRGTDGCEMVLEGRLDSNTVQACSNTLSEVLSRPIRVLLFDLTNLSFISSIGLRLVLNARKRLEAKGGSVLMTGLQPQIAKVFEIANVLPKVSIFENVEEADRYFAAMQQKVLDAQNEP